MFLSDNSILTFPFRMILSFITFQKLLTWHHHLYDNIWVPIEVKWMFCWINCSIYKIVFIEYKFYETKNCMRLKNWLSNQILRKYMELFWNSVATVNHIDLLSAFRLHSVRRFFFIFHLNSRFVEFVIFMRNKYKKMFQNMSNGCKLEEN